jgi:hypothetical protein
LYISTPTNSPKRCKKEWKQEIFFHCSFNENKPKPISKPYLYCISVKCIHKQGRQNFIAIERSLSLSPDKSYIKSTEITTKRQVYNINSFKTELCEFKCIQRILLSLKLKTFSTENKDKLIELVKDMVHGISFINHPAIWDVGMT